MLGFRIYRIGAQLLAGLLLWGASVSWGQEWGSASFSPRKGLLLWAAVDTAALVHARSAYALEVYPEGARLPYRGERQQGGVLQAEGAMPHGALVYDGAASYSRQLIRGRRGMLTASPELMYPYIVVDSARQRFDQEGYSMRGTVAYRFALIDVGLGGRYGGSTLYTQTDPRTRSRVGDFCVHAALAVKTSAYRVTLQLDYRKYLEHSSAYLARPATSCRYYYLLGGGEYNRSMSVIPVNNQIQLSHHMHRGGVAVELLAQRDYLPTIWAQMSYADAYMAQQSLPKINETFTPTVRVGLRERLQWGAHTLTPSLVYTEARRRGEEIFYAATQVVGNILQEKEKGREARWFGGMRNIALHCPYRHTSGQGEYGLAYRVEYGAWRGRYSLLQRHLSLASLSNSLEASYGRNLSRAWTLEGGVVGQYRLPIASTVGVQASQPAISQSMLAVMDHLHHPFTQLRLRLGVAWHLPSFGTLGVDSFASWAHARGEGYGFGIALQYSSN